MSYSINSGVYEREQELVAMKRLAEKFPQAFLDELPDGRSVWVSEGVQPSHFMLVASCLGSKSMVFVCPYVSMGKEGKSVFVTRDRWIPHYRLSHGDSDKHRQILALMMELR